MNDTQVIRRIVATYDYRDELGELLYQVVRYAPKDFRQRRKGEDGSWVYNLQGCRRVIYRLPEILADDTGRCVFVVEGEKDADALWKIDRPATTCSEGAGKWRPEYGEWLRDRLVAIVPDNDSAGMAHAYSVAEMLYGIAREVRIVKLPGLHHKGDVSDWLKAGGSAKKLLEIVETTPRWRPKAGVFEKEIAAMVAEEVKRIVQADNAATLIGSLAMCGISVSLDGGDLILKPSSLITEPIKVMIGVHKKAIMEVLQNGGVQ